MKDMSHQFIFGRFDTETPLWKATSDKYPKFLATSEAPYMSLLMGTHLWKVYNDSTFCAPIQTR